MIKQLAQSAANALEFLAKNMFGADPVAMRDRISAMRTQQYTDAACIFSLLTAVYLAASRIRRTKDGKQT